MTRCPAVKPRTSAPTSLTSPAHSRPSTGDAPGGGGPRPWRWARSAGRRLDDMRAGLERGLGVTRAHLAAVAAGEAPERAAILRGSPYQDIKPTDAFGLWERTPGLFVLDVRTSGEFANGDIPNAHLVPVDELEDRLGELPPPDTTMLVPCAAGGRRTAAGPPPGAEGYPPPPDPSGGVHPRARP